MRWRMLWRKISRGKMRSSNFSGWCRFFYLYIWVSWDSNQNLFLSRSCFSRDPVRLIGCNSFQRRGEFKWEKNSVHRDLWCTVWCLLSVVRSRVAHLPRPDIPHSASRSGNNWQQQSFVDQRRREFVNHTHRYERNPLCIDLIFLFIFLKYLTTYHDVPLELVHHCNSIYRLRR